MKKILNSKNKMGMQMDTIEKVIQADIQEEKQTLPAASKTTHYSVISEEASDAIEGLLIDLEENGFEGGRYRTGQIQAKRNCKKNILTFACSLAEMNKSLNTE